MNTLKEDLIALGSKPSISEENGIALLTDKDMAVFSPGISSGGFAEIRVAFLNKDRKIIATTIDKAGLEIATKNISNLGLENQIETKLEDLTICEYPNESFDFIYARLVLHYLPADKLDKVLKNFRRQLKMDGRLFVVVRSVKNVDVSDPNNQYDPISKLTKIAHKDQNGEIKAWSERYYHTPESITGHLQNAGFNIDYCIEYKEQLYKDFMRTQISSKLDDVIEILANNSLT